MKKKELKELKGNYNKLENLFNELNIKIYLLKIQIWKKKLKHRKNKFLIITEDIKKRRRIREKNIWEYFSSKEH